ncbi:MAG: 2-oxo acid dehydrogenase subunit E2 [Parvibaculales bacterium]
MSKIKAFTMPKWGIEMQEGTIAEWVVEEGQPFKKGDIIALIETDKISNEVEAEFDSVLRKIVSPTGEVLPVGALLGVFADESVGDEDVAGFVDSFEMADTRTALGEGNKAGEPKDEPAEAPQEQTKQLIPSDNLNISPKARELAIELNIDTNTITGSGRGGRITHQDVYQAGRTPKTVALKGPLETPADDESIFASPLARRIAAQNGIDLSQVSGTGARGRIRKADVLELLPQAQPGGAGAVSAPVAADNTPDIREMDKIRKVIARRLTESKSSIPHFYLRASFAVDDLLALRKTANLVLGSKASINDYLIKAVGLALVKHPDVNVQVHGDAIHHFPHADISVAIASDKGLITPVVRAADLQPVNVISDMTDALIDKANAGKISFDDLEGGSLTISNLGMFGIDQFDAIINPPQGSILAVGGIQRVWAEGEDGEGHFESRMEIAMSCDHRAIDGAAGAQFMASLKEIIENPEMIFSV